MGKRGNWTWRDMAKWCMKLAGTKLHDNLDFREKVPGDFSPPCCLFSFSSALKNTFMSLPSEGISLTACGQPISWPKFSVLRCNRKISWQKKNTVLTFLKKCVFLGTVSRWEGMIYKEQWILCCLHSYVILSVGPLWRKACNLSPKVSGITLQWGMNIEF